MVENKYQADCSNCFGLCCVALPYAKSADFPNNKDAGTPCKNLQGDFRCSIHTDLRSKGYKGCSVYECFGAGQKVSQQIYKGNDWRDNQTLATEMFEVFPIVQQLHEMLCYLNEAMSLDVTRPIYKDLQEAIKNIELLTAQEPKTILKLDIPVHRAGVNDLLLQTSELVRGSIKTKNKPRKLGRGIDLLGAKLKGADLRGSNLRGALLIAADLREADMRMSDLIGADLRDADLSGSNLLGCIFLTQAQINSAKGSKKTKLPSTLKIPEHWIKG